MIDSDFTRRSLTAKAKGVQVADHVDRLDNLQWLEKEGHGCKKGKDCL